MTIEDPGFTLPTGNERELLLSYLRAQRGDVVRSADGLDEAQLRWTPDDRLLPIIGVINHLTHVEWRWINGRYLGEPFPPRDEEFVLGPERHRRGDRRRVRRARRPHRGDRPHGGDPGGALPRVRR